MDRKYWKCVPLSLYKLTLNLLIRQTNFDVCLLKTLPGHIKEDLLDLGLMRKKGKNSISELLHPCITRLDTFQCEISNEDLLEISQCQRLRLLVIHPPKYYRFSHDTSFLNQLFCSLPYLIKLNFPNNDGVTDQTINVIKESCRLIQELDVSGCFNLTDEAAKTLSKMYNLRVLNLSDTPVGDCGLIALSQGLNSKMITHLRLNHCSNISDSGIYSLINGCGNLTKLVACGWPRVSVECQLALNSFLHRNKKEKTTWMELF